MKTYFVVIFATFGGLAQGSEFTVSLESKVNHSDLVALVTLHWFTESEEKYEVIDEDRALPRITISLTVNKILKGKAVKQIKVHAYNTNGTTGFTPHSLKLPNAFKTPRRFIAYLKKGEEGIYELTGPSNQYLEDVGPHGVSVRALGQTSERVALKVKLRQINELCQKKVEKGE